MPPESPLVIRPFAATDSIPDLTDLLHRAYADLAARGLRYLATHQDDGVTRRRVAGGECFLAEEDGRIVATIVLRGPGSDPGHPGRAWFEQFAVEPDRQGRGIGARMLAFVERRARALGAVEIALDTALPATHLIEFYARRGYREVGRVSWEVTSYESVILAKGLGRGFDEAPRECP